jgi:hypothetical protein
MSDCATCPVRCQQPFGTEITTVDGIFIKEMHIPDQFTVVPQHSHRYDHTTMLAKGMVGMKTGDDHEWRVHVAPAAIFIKAGVKHTFQSLEPDTILYCIHNVSRTGHVEVAEVHEIGDL